MLMDSSNQSPDLPLIQYDEQDFEQTISKISLHRYRVPLLSTLPVGKQRINERQGLILSIETDKGHAYAEIAPLSGLDIDQQPLMGFSQESLDQVITELKQQLPQLINQPLTALAQLANSIDYPSASFGLSLIVSKLTQQILDKRYLAPAVPLVYANADGSSNLPAVMQQITEQTNHHFPKIYSVKVKVGQIAPEIELNLIYQLQQAFPQLKFRLDANQAFSLEQALNFCACLPLDAIEYIEEPCLQAKDNLTLYHQLGIRYALDETLNQADSQLELHLQPNSGLAALVIKPSLYGSVDKLMQLISRASLLGVRTILSSALESSQGISDIKILAANLTPDEAAGIDTLAPFSQAIIQPILNKPCLALSSLEPLLICQN